MMNATDGDNALPLHRLHHRFASHLAGHRKPNAGIYAHAEQAAGIDPKRIMFFDALADNSAAARADPDGFYHGITVQHRGQPHVLCGPPVDFTPGPTIQPGLFGQG